jgi:hypothetical protein
MRRLSWRDSATAAAPPRIRVERFCGKRSRHRVHLLGEVRCKKTHYKFGENTVPCLEPEACPFCAERSEFGVPVWKSRLEFFGPALVMDEDLKLWVPIVAVFTQGAWNAIRKAPLGPDRGRLLEVERRPRGSTRVLLVKELSRIDPVVPAFDVEPHLLRLWFPDDESLPEAEIPAAVPFTTQRPPCIETPRAEPTRMTPEQLAQIKAQLARARGEVPVAPAAAAAEPETGVKQEPVAAAIEIGEQVPVVLEINVMGATQAPASTFTSPPPGAPAPKKPTSPPAVSPMMAAAARRHSPSVVANDPEALAELERKRLAKLKPAEELTPVEALEAGRILDYVVKGKVKNAQTNGQHQNGHANGERGVA